MDRPVNGLKNGEGEIVDADLLVNLLDTYRFGPFGKAYYVSAAEIGPKPETTPFPTTPDNSTKVKDEEENDGSHGNKFVHGSTSSASSNPDPINLETTKSETSSNEETGSNDETGSNEETGYDLLEANSTNSLTTENETQQNEENYEKEEKEEEIAKSKSEEESNLKKLLTIPENYELYCPNCSACITRRVILKKRKREKKQTDEPGTEPDDESSDEIEPPSKVNLSVTQPKEEQIENDFDDEEDKEEAEMFSCLACLKYFIRLGARFLQLDFIRGRPVNESVKDNLQVNNLDSKNSDTILSPPQDQPEQERFTVEVLKSTVYGGLTETITSLGVVSSAVASGSSTLNILALTIANMAGGLIVLAHNLQDLRNDRNSDQESDRYEKLLGKRANSHIHILVAILSYILFGLIPPLVYAFSFYETGIKNYKLISVFMVSLVCVTLLGMVKVYVRKPVNVRESPRSYLKSAAYYTSITVASSGISYFVGNIVGDLIEKVGWFSLDRGGMTTMFDGIEPGFNPYGSF